MKPEEPQTPEKAKEEQFDLESYIKNLSIPCLDNLSIREIIQRIKDQMLDKRFHMYQEDHHRIYGSPVKSAKKADGEEVKEEEPEKAEPMEIEGSSLA